MGGGLALAALGLAATEGGPATTLGALASLGAAVCLGVGTATGVLSRSAPNRRDVVLAVALGACAGVPAWAWFMVSPYIEPFARTGLPTLLDSLLFLPALVAALLVPRFGSLTIGLVAGVLVTAPQSIGASLVEVPLIAAPAEAWLAVRARSDARSAAEAGLCLGIAAAASLMVLRPGLIAPGEFPTELVIRVIAGTFAGLVAFRLSSWAQSGGLPITSPATAQG